MAKANQYHRAGNRFRRLTQVKIPLKERKHNKEKWKVRKEVEKEVTQYKKGKWWQKKRGGK